MPVLPDRIAAMPEDLLRPVFAHVRQQAIVGVIRDLIIQLRSCASPQDYFDFQRQLFGQVLLSQGRVDSLRRTIKRVEQGKAIDEAFGAEFSSYVGDPSARPNLDMVATHLPGVARRLSVGKHEYAWLHLEEMIARRIEIQLRAVGDALAWRALGFDRRYIHVLSRNNRTGPMTSGRPRTEHAESVDLADGTQTALPDTKAGLNWELGRATYLFEQKGSFGILNDLTNVLRIGDLTEIDNGHVVLHEVKAPSRRPDADQTRRAQQAIEAINSGSHLPGAARTRLHTSAVSPRHHLRRLRQLVNSADRDGSAAITLERGWVAAALSLGLPADRRGRRFPGTDRQEAAWRHIRDIAHRNAGIANSRTVHAVSTDTAGRTIENAPWGIYPFDPDVCARIICDYLLIESTVALTAVATAIDHLGAEVQELPGPRSLPTTDTEVLVVAMPYGPRNPLIDDHLLLQAMKITARNLRQPLLETWTLECWAATLVELFSDPDYAPGDALIPILQPETSGWR